MAKSKKQNRSVVEGDEQTKDHENVIMETYRPVSSKQVWKQKRPDYKFQDNGGLNALVPMKPTLTTKRSNLPQFRSAERLAEWVFNAAKHRPMQMKLSCCKQSEEVRDALLRRFHRWPEMKISRAVERYQNLSQEAEQQCQDQVKLFIQELRGKLVTGAKALFWLNVLQPEIHSASQSRQEVREVLLLLLEELKSVDGVYEQLMKRSERTWAVLTLPLKLEPLFEGVSTLALCGHEIAGNEAMRMLTMFAEQYAAFPKRKKDTLPVGLSVVASVGILAPLDISGLSELPEAFREQLSKPLSMMIRDWFVVVEEVLDVLEKSLAGRWASCERAPSEEELTDTVQRDLQSEFARLNHALAADQLYVVRKVGRERSSVDEDCLGISISRERGLLLVQLNRDNKYM